MKTQSDYMDYGFGFPVIIGEIDIDEWCGETIPVIDNEYLEREVLKRLVLAKTRLTGNQVRFFRHHFMETLEEFAAKAGVKHTAVLKWERAQDERTKMAWGTEFLIRSRALRDAGDSMENCQALVSLITDPPPRDVCPTVRVPKAVPEASITLGSVSLRDAAKDYGEAHLLEMAGCELVQDTAHCTGRGIGGQDALELAA